VRGPLRAPKKDSERMKIVEVAQVLAVISKIYAEAGNRGTADGILTFAELLRDYKDATVSQVKKELSRRRPNTADTNATERDAVRISEIRAVLDKLRLIYTSSGAKSQATDCEKLSEALDSREGEFVGTFVKAIRNAVTEGQQPAEDVGKYASPLLAAGTNDVDFNTVFSAMKSDRRVTKPILDAIANRYLNQPTGSNHVYKFKNKTHAFDTIKDKFFERAQAKSKGDIIHRLMSGS
jgi:hypothetical protein